MTPKVSIVIPCYNAVKTISRCLDSVLSQTYRDFEIIVVNSNSDDGTTKILEKYSNKNIESKLYIFNLAEKQSAAQNRNFGISKSNGKYVAFLDADDYWFPNKLEYQISLLEKYDIDLLGCQTTSNNSFKKRKQKLKKINLKQQLLKNQFLTSTVIYKRELNLVFSLKYKLSEDNFAWCNIIDRGYISYVSNQIVSYYELPFDGTHLSSKLKDGHYWEKEVLNYFKINKRINIFNFLFLRVLYFLKYIKRIINFKLGAENAKTIIK